MAAPVPKRKRSRFAVICVALGLVTGSLTLAKPGNRYSPFQFASNPFAPPSRIPPDCRIGSSSRGTTGGRKCLFY